MGVTRPPRGGALSRVRESRSATVRHIAPGLWSLACGRGRRLCGAPFRSVRCRNSRTILSLEKLQYNLPMKEDDFTIQALRN